ncbi:hypothetical protein MAR_031663 [Mya arenaria]|uniref:OTU domain-containing protein n=1 Tax=Mya arenaria TaxID=6604 RepID=A0ABY7F6S4_MYAAR|nr:hypothetical protein MAR_031663 [Mya arenaria]
MAEDKQTGYTLRVKLEKRKSPDIISASRSETVYERFRKRLKKDPVAYEAYKTTDAEKQRKYRRSLIADKRKEYNEKCKFRMKKYRLKKNRDGIVPNEKPSTRKQIEKKRQYWRKKKQEQRINMSLEQRQKGNRERRERYKNAKVKLNFETPKAKVAEKRMPKSPEKFAAMLQNALFNTTPKKKEACRKRGLVFSPKSHEKNKTNARIVAELKLNLKELKKNQTKRGRQEYYLVTRAILRKNAMEAKFKKELEIKWKLWMNMSETELDEFKRSDAMKMEVKQEIERFYLNESVQMPTKSTFKLDSVNRICNDLKKPHLKIQGKYECVEKTLCPKEDDESRFHKFECYQRNCKTCGIAQLQEHFSELNKSNNQKPSYKWKRWQLGEVGHGTKKVMRQVLQEKSGTIQELVLELLTEVEFLSKHLFVADWQLEESAVFITPDLIHDADAVNMFTTQMNDHLKESIPFSHRVQFSDGCAAQFKSKRHFQHVSESKEPSMERAFFGSRHGKSRCDPLGGLVKKQSETFVRSRKGTIRDAKQMFEFCEANLSLNSGGKCEHKKRVFFYNETIKRDTENKKLKTLKGTHNVHNVRGVEIGKVEARNLSCFCDACRKGLETASCKNSSYVQDWEVHTISESSQDGKKQVNKKTSKGSKGKTMCEDTQKDAQPAKVNIGKRRNGKQSTDQKIQQHDLILGCKSFKDLKILTNGMNTEPLQEREYRSFSDTGKDVDKSSINLLPSDIPLQTCEMYPATICGDGNCLPRSASVLAYGNEEKHTEMRDRIVAELGKNEKHYLDNRIMKKGKHTEGNEDVTKVFAHVSPFYNGQKLTKPAIKKICEREVLEVRNNGEWMDLWQIASLANILGCPVVSVCPQYGTHTIRHDMHRVFYPFSDKLCEDPVFIMWTNLKGDKVPEELFSLNHFTVLLPLNSKTFNNNSLLDLSYGTNSTDEKSVVNNDNILNLISDMFEEEINYQPSEPMVADTDGSSPARDLDVPVDVIEDDGSQQTSMVDCGSDDPPSEPMVADTDGSSPARDLDVPVDDGSQQTSVVDFGSDDPPSEPIVADTYGSSPARDLDVPVDVKVDDGSQQTSMVDCGSDDPPSEPMVADTDGSSPARDLDVPVDVKVDDGSQQTSMVDFGSDDPPSEPMVADTDGSSPARDLDVPVDVKVDDGSQQTSVVDCGSADPPSGPIVTDTDGSSPARDLDVPVDVKVDDGSQQTSVVDFGSDDRPSEPLVADTDGSSPARDLDVPVDVKVDDGSQQTSVVDCGSADPPSGPIVTDTDGSSLARDLDVPVDVKVDDGSQQTRYQIGNYIIVQHGQSLIHAVVGVVENSLSTAHKYVWLNGPFAELPPRPPSPSYPTHPIAKSKMAKSKMAAPMAKSGKPLLLDYLLILTVLAYIAHVDRPTLSNSTSTVGTSFFSNASRFTFAALRNLPASKDILPYYRQRYCLCTLLLLLSGDIQTNPGPTTRQVTTLNFLTTDRSHNGTAPGAAQNCHPSGPLVSEKPVGYHLEAGKEGPGASLHADAHLPVAHRLPDPVLNSRLKVIAGRASLGGD